MIRTFVPSLIIASLLAGFVAADVPKQNTPVRSSQVLYHPGKDKFMVIHPVYRPGVDKFTVIHPVYRPGIDKFVVRNLSYPASPVISKQTIITSTSNINEETLNLRGSTLSGAPAAKSERGSSGCAKQGDRSLL